MDLGNNKLYNNEEKLKFVIGYLGLSGIELAKVFETSTSTISNWQNSSQKKLKKFHLHAFHSIYGIPLEIFEDKIMTEVEVGELLNKNDNSLFNQNIDFLKKLTRNNGIWYFYNYPSNNNTYKIKRNRIRINSNFTVSNWGKKAKIYVGKNQTMLIIETTNSNNLVSIIFDNMKIDSKIISFSKVSKVNGSHKDMLSFGFCSQSEFELNKAKEILGEMEKMQLKIDYKFLERIEENIV